MERDQSGVLFAGGCGGGPLAGIHGGSSTLVELESAGSHGISRPFVAVTLGGTGCCRGNRGELANCTTEALPPPYISWTPFVSSVPVVSPTSAGWLLTVVTTCVFGNRPVSTFCSTLHTRLLPHEGQTILVHQVVREELEEERLVRRVG